ncbi:MAG: hypothetical protein IH899_12015 [Planctomycetes bacterium]|nr:hypothetical protein [Planctomycetota bacterium]
MNEEHVECLLVGAYAMGGMSEVCEGRGFSRVLREHVWKRSASPNRGRRRTSDPATRRKGE